MQSLALVAGPLMFAVSTFFWQHDGRYGVIAGPMVVLALVLWLYGLLALFDALRARLPRYVAVALLLAVYGAIGGSNFGLRGFYDGVFHLSSTASLAALAPYSTQANLMLFWPGPLFPLSLLSLAVTLTWTRTVPLWSGILLGVGAAAFPFGIVPRIPWIAHLIGAVLVAAFLHPAWICWRGRLQPGGARSDSAGPASPDHGSHGALTTAADLGVPWLQRSPGRTRPDS
jgi:hypothetical protein